MKNQVWSDEELSSLRFIDQVLPSQPHLRKMYEGDKFYEKMTDMLFSVLDDHGDIKFKVKFKDGMSYAAMGSGVNTLHFYQFLIRLGRYKRILELGTYIGVSTMYLAEATKEFDGNVTTVEIGKEFFDLAAHNFSQNNLHHYIWLVYADCRDFFKMKFDAPYDFDFILIDAAKESYRELLDLSIQRLLPGGIIVIDDVFFQGDALNDEPISEKGKGVKECVEYTASFKGWDRVILPIGNGLMLMRRKL